MIGHKCKKYHGYFSNCILCLCSSGSRRVNKKVKFAEVQCKTWASAVELNFIAYWIKHFQSCEEWFSPGTEPQCKCLHTRLTDKSKMTVCEMRTCSLTWALTSPSPQDSWDRWSWPLCPWELEKQWLETNGWLNEWIIISVNMSIIVNYETNS